MASRIRKRSSFSTASREWITLVRYCARPIDASTTIIVSTTSSSMSVNPLSPVFVLRAIECRPSERRIHVEHVLTAPPGGIRLVLIGPQAPLGAVKHRVERHPSQELELPAGGVVRRGHAVHELLQVRRIILAAGFQIERADDAKIGG